MDLCKHTILLFSYINFLYVSSENDSYALDQIFYSFNKTKSREKMQDCAHVNALVHHLLCYYPICHFLIVDGFVQ
jgi:hypothetical protein